MNEIRITESAIEKYSGLLLAVFSLLLYFFIIPVEIGIVKKAVVAPQTLPKVLTAFMFFLSLLLSVGGFFKNRRADQKIYSFSIPDTKYVAISILVIAIYILVLKYLGYIATTALSLFGLMFLFGQRKMVKTLIIAVAIPIAIKLFFEVLMKINLP